MDAETTIYSVFFFLTMGILLNRGKLTDFCNLVAYFFLVVFIVGKALINL